MYGYQVLLLEYREVTFYNSRLSISFLVNALFCIELRIQMLWANLLVIEWLLVGNHFQLKMYSLTFSSNLVMCKTRIFKANFSKKVSEF